MIFRPYGLLMFGVLVIFFLVTTETKRCPWYWKKYRDHCYHLFNVRMNWFQAQMFCRQFGAGLVEVENIHEDLWLKKNFGRQVIWLGGTDLGREGNWRWFLSGKHIGYQKWGPTQPSNSGNEDCLEDNRPPGAWNDISCYRETPFICESM